MTIDISQYFEGEVLLLLILGGIVLYLLLPVFVSLFLRGLISDKARKRVMWVVVAAWILFPAGDYIAGRSYHGFLCVAGQPGLRVFRTVEEDVKGALLKHSGSGVALFLLKRYGYQYIEAGARRAVGKISRYTLDADGDLIEEIIERPTSRYTFEEYRIPRSLNITEFEWTVEDSFTGDRLAVYREYGYFGGWVARKLPRYSYYCPSTTSDFLVTFHTDVLGKEFIQN